MSKLMQDILKTVLAGAIMATCAAALSTWLEVKLLRHDLDELRKDVDRLWSETSEQVALFQGGEKPMPDVEYHLAEARKRLLELERGGTVTAASVDAAAAAPK